MDRQPIIAIAIATAGRRQVLVETLGELRRQTRAADAVYICPAQEADVDREAIVRLDLPVVYCDGPRGASAQRNAILARVAAADLVVFLDDDFVMAPTYLEEVERLFAAHPDVVVATGHLICDDVNGPGLSLIEATSLIATDLGSADPALHEVFNGYGCNMAVDWRKLAGRNVAFDERLPLYSWAEDVDFSRQASAFGRIVRSDRLRGVHRAVKNGRTAGVRFGYSQVANQWYLSRKGTVPAHLALLYGGRNILANLRRAIRPEPYIDRRGRLLGNWLGLVDLVRGRADPERILKL